MLGILNASFASFHKTATRLALGAVLLLAAGFLQVAPAQLNISASINNDVLCNGDSSGSASATASGGMMPYDFFVVNAMSGDTLDAVLNTTGNTYTSDSLPKGSYRFYVRDDTGAIDSAAFTLTQPAPLMASLTKVDVQCNGQANGQLIVASQSGGTAPYDYNWSTGDTTVGASGLTAGPYTVTITDQNGCTLVKEDTVTEPDPLQAALNTRDIACFGNDSGVVGVVQDSLMGGTPPYSYSWNTGATTDSLVNVGAGVYTVTITDSNGCTLSLSDSIQQPPKLTTSLNVSSISCFGANDGAIGIEEQGGTQPYAYSWQDTGGTSFGTSDSIMNLSESVYIVTVTDDSGCVRKDTATVTEPDSLTLLLDSTDVSCNGGADGSASVQVGGGTVPYSYSWSNGATADSIGSLTAGSYTVTVTDANGCSKTATITIDQPAQLQATLVADSVACAGGSNGVAQVDTTFGGTAPYSYSWTNGGSSPLQSGLSAGTYGVTVTDQQGCTFDDSIQVGEPDALMLDAVATNLACNGDSNGTANVGMLAGGTMPYRYSWSTGDSTALIDSLGAGTYTLTVTDTNGCTITDTAIVNQPAPIAITFASTPASCSGGGDGSAVADTVTGGTAPYSYSWSTGAATPGISSKAAGTYSLTITDANGCTRTDSVTITQPGSLMVFTSSTPALCNSDTNGSVTLDSIAGGTPPYTFGWSTGDSTNTVDSLPAGTYTLSLQDSQGCTLNENVTVNQPDSLKLMLSATAVSCNGGSDGMVRVDSTLGGTAPYSYSWSTGATTSQDSGLTAGTYSVVVTDSNNCSLTDSITVSEPDSLKLYTSSDSVSCNGDTDGIVRVDSVQGGTMPYSYSWSTGDSTQQDTGLDAGGYAVTITDANGCTVSDSVFVGEPAPLNVSINKQNVQCKNADNGTAQAVVSGGTMPYSYNWSTGPTSDAITGLAPGSYQVTVTDAEGCNNTATVNITEPSALTLSLDSTNLSCFNAGDGSALATVNGGTTPYSYNWSSGDTTALANNLQAGSYSLTVTDANGCSISGSVTLTQPAPILLSTSKSDVKCNGGNSGTASVSISSGQAAQSFTWTTGNTSQSISGLTAGTYGVTVTATSGCSASTTVTVDEPAPIQTSLNVSNVNCNGGATGAIGASVTGGTSPYNYSWNTGAATQLISGLTAGNYELVVSDAEGCVDTTQATVTQPAPININLNTTDVSCNGGADGSVAASVSGGTAPYFYSWSNGSSNDTLMGVGAGQYILTVTDGNGCIKRDTAIITEPAPLSLSFTSTDITCNGGTNGSASVAVSGGTAPYSYSWSNGATTDSLAGLSAGSYTVTVTDAQGCTIQGSVTINEPAPILTSITTGNVACNGDTTGSASVSVTNGVAPLSYSWSNGDSSASISNVTAGLYTVTITDANGCSTVDTAQISEPAPLLTSMGMKGTSCNGASDGMAFIDSIGGGTAPYSVSWQNGAMTDTIGGLSAGTYGVTITDANGCTRTDSIMVTEPGPLSFSLNTNDVSCAGQQNGAVSIPTINGGTAPYAISWSTGSTLSTIQGLTPGSYSVTVTDANGCSRSDSATVDSGQVVNVTASAAQNPVCQGQSVQLFATGAASYQWNTGDTTASITVQPQGNTVYSITGVTPQGCQAMDTVQVQILANPQGSFTASATNIQTGDTVSFQNQGAPSQNYKWRVNGQVFSTSFNAQRAFTQAGSYVIELVAFTNAGCSEVVQSTTIQVSQPQTQNLFSGSPVTGTAPLTVQFALNDTAVDAHNWQFGDGQQAGPFAGSGNAPSHTYTSPGTYTVTLFKKKSGNVQQQIRKNYVTVLPAQSKPAADFKASATSGTAPFSTQLLNLTPGTNQYSWTVSNSNGQVVLTSSKVSPNVTLTKPGTYNVELTATNNFGTDTETKQQYLTVGSGAAGGELCLDAPQNVTAGQQFQVRVQVNNVQTPLSAINPTVSYDANVLDFVSAQQGSFFNNATPGIVNDNPAVGEVSFGTNAQPGQSQTGNGLVYTLTFTVDSINAASGGNVTFAFSDRQAIDSAANTLQLASCGATPVSLITGPFVWPGDADNNGTVQTVDYVVTASQFGKAGPTRPKQGIQFQAFQAGMPWSQSVNVQGQNVNLQYVDASGDGQISNLDLSATIIHKTKQHNKTGQSTAGETVQPLAQDSTTAGSTVRIPITIGSNNDPVDSLQGVEFAIELDGQFGADAATMDFSNAAWGTYGTDFVANTDRSGQTLTVTMAGKGDNSALSGNGTLLELVVPIDSAAASGTVASIDVANLVGYDTNFDTLSLSAGSDAIAIVDTIEVDLNTDREAAESSTEAFSVSVFPNPTAGQITVRGPFSHQQPGALRVLDGNGRVVFRERLQQEQQQLRLPLSKGVYYLDLRQGNDRAVRKLMIR